MISKVRAVPLDQPWDREGAQRLGRGDWKKGRTRTVFVDKPIVIPVCVARKEVKVRPCIESPAEGLGFVPSGGKRGRVEEGKSGG